MTSAKRLEELRLGAISEGAPFAVVSLDNVLRLAIGYARDLEARLEDGGGQVIELRPKEAPAPVERPGA